MPDVIIIRVIPGEDTSIWTYPADVVNTYHMQAFWRTSEKSLLSILKKRCMCAETDFRHRPLPFPSSHWEQICKFIFSI